jgi:hypothetical protein
MLKILTYVEKYAKILIKYNKIRVKVFQNGTECPIFEEDLGRSPSLYTPLKRHTLRDL